MNTGDLQNTETQDVIAMAERIFRGAVSPANHEDWGETCPFTMESLLNCTARNDRRGQEPCPYTLEICME